MSETAKPAAAGAPPADAGWRHYLRAVGALVRKDVTAEFRSWELIGAMLVFSVLVILLFNFALELQVQLRSEITSGVLWVTLTFAGTLGLNRAMASEQERNSLDGLLLAPVDRSALFFGKTLANWLFMLLVAAIVLPLFGVLYNTSLVSAGMLLVVLLGTAGYAAVGTLLATMAIQTRTRDMLLPILLFPVILPALIAAVKASDGFLQALPMEAIRPWLNLLVAFDVIFLAAAMMVFDYVVQE